LTSAAFLVCGAIATLVDYSLPGRGALIVLAIIADAVVCARLLRFSKRRELAVVIAEGLEARGAGQDERSTELLRYAVGLADQPIRELLSRIVEIHDGETLTVTLLPVGAREPQ
jgi:hypothetical protein